jgi:hypothetical protein
LTILVEVCLGSVATELRYRRHVRSSPNRRHESKHRLSTFCANRRHREAANETLKAKKLVTTPSRMLPLALNDHNEAVYLPKLDRWKKSGVELCKKFSEVANGPVWIPWQELSDVSTLGQVTYPACWCAMLGRAKSGPVAAISLWCSIVSAARIIPGHPGVAAFRKSAKKDAF